MKYLIHPLILLVFKLFIFSRCENITITKIITSKAPDLNSAQQNKTAFKPKSIELSDESLEDSLSDFSGEKSKDFDWKYPQFIETFKFDHKHDNSSLEKLLNILTPFMNLTSRLDNDTKDFDWSDEELTENDELLSVEDKDFTSFDFKVGTFIQKISPQSNPDSGPKISKPTEKTSIDYKPKSLEPTSKIIPDSTPKFSEPTQKTSIDFKPKSLEPTSRINPDSAPKFSESTQNTSIDFEPKSVGPTRKTNTGFKLKSLESALNKSPDFKLKSLGPPRIVASKDVPASKNLSEKGVVNLTELQSNGSRETAASSDVETMLGEPSSPMLYRISRAASNPPEPFISRRFSVNSLRELMDYYEPLRLPGLEELNITHTCQKNMELYIEALNKRIPWALKMLDSSGHYGGSFYNGNTYWLGSSTLCYRISQHPSRVPFKLGFFTARADLEFASLEPRERRQFVGVCLPLSCQDHDVTQLLVHSAQEAPASSERTVAISHVRTPHSYYYMTRDPLVICLVIVTVVVLTLLAAGTGLDLYLTYHESCVHGKNKKLYDNYNYAISNVGLPSNEMKMDVSGHDSPAGTVLQTEETHDLLTEMLLSFSVIRNMKQICDQSVGVDTIPTVHGFRALSMAWVILGHTCIIAFKYADNMEYRVIVQEEFVFQVVTNATFSVDTFFFISGLLVSFLYFRTVSKIDVTLITKATGFASGCLEFIGLIGYRFLRLTAPYIFVLLVNLVCMKYFFYNSVFEPPTDDHVNCAKYWWRNILYINTMFPQKDMCMLWSWYLADDTQFYILSLILLILAVKYFKAAAATLGVFLVVSWMTTMTIAYTNNHMPNYDDPLSLFDKIYDKPWTRLGPYLIGISVGWILYKTDCTIKMNKLTIVTGWFLSVFSLLVMVFGVYGSSLHPLTAATYSALSHSLWAMSLAFIVIACSTGYGGYINSLLSAKCLYPFSRVTYCAYLVHPLVMRVMVMLRDSPIHLGKDIVITLFIGQLVASYFIAFFVSLAFEAPMVTMLKIVSPTKRRRRLQ